MNEPIAYVTGVRQFDPVMADAVLKVGTPLYTHPAKTLTDEEIDFVAKEIDDKEEQGDSFDFWYREFARAILKKASEK